MNTQIINKLNKIEADSGVRILFACESGSRGWQFPSLDSDYDVRFIFIRPLNDYLSISQQGEQIGFPISDELDIFGWDIRKMLRLIQKSNTTPLEWLQSPIVYSQQPQFRDELWAICGKYFNRSVAIRHYLGIARTAMGTMGNFNEIVIKKLFYVIRSLLTAKWCSEKNTIAPMSIYALLPLMPDKLQQITNDLIICKSKAPEGFIVQIEPELLTYLNREFEAFTQFSEEKSKLIFDAEPLDIFFRKWVRPSF